MSGDPYTEERARVLAAAIPRAGETGWTEALLAEAGNTASLASGHLMILFPEGVRDLLSAYSDHLDAEMERALTARDLTEMRVRDRIRLGVTARLEAMAPHPAAGRRAAQLLALPPYAPLGAELVYRTVDRLWRAAGDRSTDFNFYTKRALAAGVYVSTLAMWFRDRSEGKEDTWRFLERRIDGVMMIEGAKITAKRLASALPSPWKVLGILRYPDPPADQAGGEGGASPKG